MILGSSETTRRSRSARAFIGARSQIVGDRRVSDRSGTVSAWNRPPQCPSRVEQRWIRPVCIHAVQHHRRLRDVCAVSPSGPFFSTGHLGASPAVRQPVPPQISSVSR